MIYQEEFEKVWRGQLFEAQPAKKINNPADYIEGDEEDGQYIYYNCTAFVPQGNGEIAAFSDSGKELNLSYACKKCSFRLRDVRKVGSTLSEGGGYQEEEHPEDYFSTWYKGECVATFGGTNGPDEVAYKLVCEEGADLDDVEVIE